MTNKELLKKAKPKLLFFDIETSPILAYTYPLFDVNIPTESIQEDMKITSIAWQFEGEKRVSVVEWGVKRDDRDLLIKFSKILNLADIIVGQNSDAFDMKTIQWRLNVLGLPPIKKIPSIDTLKESRRAFRPTSHKLDYKSRILKLGGKLPQSMRDCIAVAKGDRKAQAKRIEYNKKDVVDLRTIFWREVDTYPLTKGLITFIKKFIQAEALEREFCSYCKKYKHKYLNVMQKGKQVTCLNCGRKWKAKHAE